MGLGVVVGILVTGVGGVLAYGAVSYGERLSFPSVPLPHLEASSDPAVIARGRYLVTGPAHCSQCHSTTDRAHPEKITPDHPLTGGLQFSMGPIATTYSANLTPDPTGIGSRSDGELARTLRTGVLHDGTLSFMMRFAAAHPSDEDIVAMLSYLRSLPPAKNEPQKGSWGALGKTLVTFMKPEPASKPPPRHVAESPEPSVARGEYLAEHVALCVGCHSKVDMSSFELTGPRAGGGEPQPSHGSDTDKEFVTPNLTSDPTGVTGRLTEDAFTGRLRAGRVFASSIMPWECFKELTDSDARSIYRYLRSLPPVKNDVGPTYRDRGWKPGD